MIDYFPLNFKKMIQRIEFIISNRRTTKVRFHRFKVVLFLRSTLGPTLIVVDIKQNPVPMNVLAFNRIWAVKRCGYLLNVNEINSEKHTTNVFASLERCKVNITKNKNITTSITRHFPDIWNKIEIHLSSRSLLPFAPSGGASAFPTVHKKELHTQTRFAIPIIKLPGSVFLDNIN